MYFTRGGAAGPKKLVCDAPAPNDPISTYDSSASDLRAPAPEVYICMHGVTKGEHYIAKDCRHRKNMRLQLARQPTIVLEQVVTSSNCVEKERKKVQFATLFQILFDGRPLTEYASRFELYDFLSLPNNPRKHWSAASDWEMANHMYNEVKDAIVKEVRSTKYIAVTADEVSTVDNGSWTSVHAYIVKNWVRLPFLVSLQQAVEGGNSDNLTSIIVQALVSRGGLSESEAASKLCCCGADGVSAFQGARKGVSKQLMQKWASFFIAMHCMAHWTNLAVKTLSQLGVFIAIEVILQKSHAYFKHSPKRHLKFTKLAEVMETKGLKLLKNVKTRCVSLLEPLRRLLSQYRVVMAKMIEDVEDNKDAKETLALLTDPYTVMGILCLMPLLDYVDTLVQFAQS